MSLLPLWGNPVEEKYKLAFYYYYFDCLSMFPQRKKCKFNVCRSNIFFWNKHLENSKHRTSKRNISIIISCFLFPITSYIFYSVHLSFMCTQWKHKTKMYIFYIQPSFRRILNSIINYCGYLWLCYLSLGGLWPPEIHTWKNIVYVCTCTRLQHEGQVRTPW